MRSFRGYNRIMLFCEKVLRLQSQNFLVIKKKIRDSIEKQLKSEKPITDVVADFTPCGKEFLTSMKVLENGIEQFGINVLVTDREIAKAVCVYLKNNAARLFSNINEEIDAVFYTGEKE